MSTAGRVYTTILLLCLYACYKKDSVSEAIPLKDLPFKTTLKNHTPGADYLVSGTLEVNNSLTIEEGVEIVLEPGSEIIVGAKGSINATGSKANPVKFRCTDGNSRWGCIRIQSALDNMMANVIVSGAGGLGNNHGAVEVMQGAKLGLFACTIEGNGDASGVMQCETSICSIDGDCKIHNNAFPVQMDFHATLNVQSANGLKGNKQDMIRVINQDGSALTTHAKVQLSNCGLPYYITSGITVGSPLVINNGVSLVFEGRSGIVVPSGSMNGSFIVNGTPDQQVSFSSFTNESRWSGIQLEGGSSRITNARLQACYLDSTGKAILTIRGMATAECRYCTFYAQKSCCNISLEGKYIKYNGDIVTRNTFTNGTICDKP